MRPDRRPAPIEPPAGAPLLRVKLDEDLDEGEWQLATVLIFDAAEEVPEDRWVETSRKIKVYLWGCQSIDADTHCTAQSYCGQWFVTKACC